MATLITRELSGTNATAKGTPLTNADMDNNLININNEIATKVDQTAPGVSVRPSLSLDFKNEKVLDPRIVYTRDSTGTYYGNTTVKGDENTVLYSSTMNTSVASTLETVIAAPDGTMTAYKTNVIPFITLNCYGIGGNCTWSVYAKPNGSNFFCYRTPDNAGVPLVYFDLINNKCSSPGGFVVDAGNGWKRCVYRPTSTHSVLALAYTNSFTASVQGTGGVYLWGPQVENRLQLTEYVPTGASAVSKSFFPIVTASANVPRFDNDPLIGASKGLLVEETRTNLLVSTDKFDSLSWARSSASVKANATIAPDGTCTAYKLVEDLGINHHLIIPAYIGITANTQTTFSCYIKPAERKFAILGFSYSSNYVKVIFDLTLGTYTPVVAGTGAALNNASIVAVGNGWYRCSVTGIVNTTTTIVTPSIATASSTVYGGHLGDNYSGIYVWGPQAEAGYMATSYIPSPFVYNGRASTGNSIVNGVLQSAVSGALRYDNGNMLLEGNNTSLLSYTENMNQWTKTNVNIIDYSIPDAFENQRGSRIIETAIVGNHYFSQKFTGTAAVYNASIYLKAAERNWVLLELFDGTSVVGSAYYDLSLGTCTAGTISPMANQWFRCNISGTMAVSVDCELRVYITESNGTVSYMGIPRYGVYAFGAQVELGTLSSYYGSKETFVSRASIGTYFDKSSTTLAESNILSWNSQDFNWSATGLTIANNDATVLAPDGTYTAAKVLETAVNSTHNSWRDFTFVNATTYTWSMFAKANGRNILGMNPRSGSTDLLCYFNLSDGSSTGPANVTRSCVPIKDGWYRCSATTTTIATAGFFSYFTTDNSASPTYVGDVTKGIYVWGAQIEQRSVMGPYTPRTTAVVNTYVPRMFTMSAELPRISYDPNTRATKGLLLERATTNLLLQSETFSGWVQNARVMSGTISPSGSLAKKLVSVSNGTAQNIVYNYAKDIVNITYTASVYVKYAEYTNLTLLCGDNNDNAALLIANGVLTATASGGFSVLNYYSEVVGNDWYRLILTFTSDNTESLGVEFHIGPTATLAYTGNDYSGLYVWGAQLEEGATVTSYIPSATTNGVRSADISTSIPQNRTADTYSSTNGVRQADALSITGSNFNSWYRQDEGSFYFDAAKLDNRVAVSTLAILTQSANSWTNSFAFNFNNVTNLAQALLYVNSVNTAGPATNNNTFMPLVFNKLAVGFKQNDMIVFGQLNSAVDTSFNMLDNVARLDIGGATNFNGHIKKLAYYPARLSNTELQYLVQ